MFLPLGADTNSTCGKVCHKHKGGGYEHGRAKEIFQEKFGPASNQEGGEYECDRSKEFGEAYHQEGYGYCSRAEEIFQEEFFEAHYSLESDEFARVVGRERCKCLNVEYGRVFNSTLHSRERQEEETVLETKNNMCETWKQAARINLGTKNNMSEASSQEDSVEHKKEMVKVP